MKQTAVKFIEGKSDSFDTQMRRKFFYQNTVEQLMIDFAKYHVEKALKIEKEQRNTLLKYIEEVRDLCDKLRFPTEGELRELAYKADGILKQFKQQEQ